jgi:hypothetical protein
MCFWCDNVIRIVPISIFILKNLKENEFFFVSPTENAEETFFSFRMRYWFKLSHEEQATPDTALCFVCTKLIKRTRSDEVFCVCPHVWSTSRECALVEKEHRVEWYKFYFCALMPRFIKMKLILSDSFKMSLWTGTVTERSSTSHEGPQIPFGTYSAFWICNEI